MVRIVLIIGLTLVSLLNDPCLALSGPNCNRRERRPYGGYCQGPRWGWYGARNPVKTVEEAKKLLVRFFAGDDLSIGPITEREWYFEADVNDGNSKLIDRVIVDKRTGRIRSIY